MHGAVTELVALALGCLPCCQTGYKPAGSVHVVQQRLVLRFGLHGVAKTSIGAVPELQPRFRNTGDRNGAWVPALPGAALSCPSASGFQHGVSLSTLWSKLGVCSLAPRGANRPIRGLAALGSE